MRLDFVLQGAYNPYIKVQAYWPDTIFMDNLRGGDATGAATPGAQEVTGANPGNTVHTVSTSTYAGSIGDGY